MSDEKQSRHYNFRSYIDLTPTVPFSVRYLMPIIDGDKFDNADLSGRADHARDYEVSWKSYFVFALLYCTLVLGLAFWFIRISEFSGARQEAQPAEVTAAPAMALVGRLDLLLLVIDRPRVHSDVCRYDPAACYEAICRSDEAPPKDYCLIQDGDQPYRRQVRSHQKTAALPACKPPGLYFNYQLTKMLMTRGSPCGIALV